jgi:hypothetical protein
LRLAVDLLDQKRQLDGHQRFEFIISRLWLAARLARSSFLPRHMVTHPG